MSVVARVATSVNKIQSFKVKGIGSDISTWIWILTLVYTSIGAILIIDSLLPSIKLDGKQSPFELFLALGSLALYTFIALISMPLLLCTTISRYFILVASLVYIAYLRRSGCA